MSFSVHNLKYKDYNDLATEIEFIIACNRIKGEELVKITLSNIEMQDRFQNAITKHLRAMKRDGAIKMFIFEPGLESQEKTESIYLINKFPFLSELQSYDNNTVYIKI